MGKEYYQVQCHLCLVGYIFLLLGFSLHPHVALTLNYISNFFFISNNEGVVASMPQCLNVYSSPYLWLFWSQVGKQDGTHCVSSKIPTCISHNSEWKAVKPYLVNWGKGEFIKRISSRMRRLENQAYRRSESKMFNKGVPGKSLGQHSTSLMLLPTVPSMLARFAQNWKFEERMAK